MPRHLTAAIALALFWAFQWVVVTQFPFAAKAEPNWDYTLDGYCRWKLGIELRAQPTAAQFVAFNNCRAMMLGMLVAQCLGNSTIVTERITDCIDEYVEGIAPAR